MRYYYFPCVLFPVLQFDDTYMGGIISFPFAMLQACSAVV